MMQMPTAQAANTASDLQLRPKATNLFLCHRNQLARLKAQAKTNKSSIAKDRARKSMGAVFSVFHISYETSAARLRRLVVATFTSGKINEKLTASLSWDRLFATHQGQMTMKNLFFTLPLLAVILIFAGMALAAPLTSVSSAPAL